MTPEELNAIRAEIHALSRTAFTPWYERRCRDCGELFGSAMPDTGTKWTQLCSECLEQEVR